MGTLFECALTGEIYGDAEMQEVFGDQRKLQGWLDTEAALATVQGELGIIPKRAAQAIKAAARAELHDIRELGQGVDKGRQHILYTMVKSLAMVAGEEASGYVHFGATTQDIIDTGLVLQLRDGLSILDSRLSELERVVAEKARTFRSTPQAGRTHWQHAVPITFGLKFAFLLDELMRHRTRFEAVKADVLVAQLGGGGGTLASFGPEPLVLQARFCEELKLGIPSTPWFLSRDRTVGLVGFLGHLAASLERTLLLVGRLAATEVGEVAEPRKADQVGSSTMPQKRNPIQVERAAALCKLVRGLAPIAQETMVVEHDRDMATFMAEWFVIPQAMILTAAALAKTIYILDGMMVDTDRMATNLKMTGGGINAESVMMELSTTLGRLEAHDIMLRATKRAEAEGIPLVQVLQKDNEVTDLVSPERLEFLLEPVNYLGVSEQLVDRVLAEYHRSQQSAVL